MFNFKLLECVFNPIPIVRRFNRQYKCNPIIQLPTSLYNIPEHYTVMSLLLFAPLHFNVFIHSHRMREKRELIINKSCWITIVLLSKTGYLFIKNKIRALRKKSNCGPKIDSLYTFEFIPIFIEIGIKCYADIKYIFFCALEYFLVCYTTAQHTHDLTIKRRNSELNSDERDRLFSLFFIVDVGKVISWWFDAEKKNGWME